GKSDERSLRELVLAQLQPEVALDHLERVLGRGEERLITPRAHPEWPPDAAGEKDGARPALVDPGGGHGAAQLLERLRTTLVRLCEGEDRLRVDGHLRLASLEAVGFHQLVVVEDDPVVDADDGAMPDR